MTQKPFEVVARCVLSGLPGTGDIAALAERLEASRRAMPDVVRAAAVPPAVYRDGGYSLEARLLVWADNGDAALVRARGLLESATVPCTEVYLSGRAISDTDAPRPDATRRAGTAAAPAGAPARRAAGGRQKVRRAPASHGARTRARAKPAAGRGAKRSAASARKKSGGRSSGRQR